ncbi:Crp/Fnr family transcriptional regulator [Limnohabitans sp.]|jgi:CRP-like cAMP-binding protein|uniref:Crp/Fnr family transcriptional regulator n=1 Tax=Limnohabitans sp. TaxID=1907725 RepID=UPI0035B0949A
MLQAIPTSLQTPTQRLGPGAVLLRRGECTEQVLHLERGRVMLGLLDQGGLHHQLGVVEGPFWLEASSGLLGLPHAVDAVAETEVSLQPVALAEFRAHVDLLPEPSRSLLGDLARAQRQQTELAISRLAKDADARCAEWLMQHAERDPTTNRLQVSLHERKRSIAAHLGIAPETFSRILRQLRERELISGRGRVLQLTNPDALRTLAGA